jgi:hypothetical protein
MIKNMKLLRFVMIGVIVILLPSCRGGTEIEVSNKDRGEIIIDALYKYKADHDSFPNELSALVPDYLEEVLTTTGGQNFLYRTNPTDGFFLFFEMNSDYGCGYTDKLKQWECSSGD